MVGDLPFAEVKPPENVLFVCKLNPVTADDDLELIFSRFGTVLSCEVIRDRKTADSLQYAFVEFENQKDCEQAYFKMQDVLIDDHRIHVDFSQSVSKLSSHWRDGENAKRKTRKQAPGAGWGGVKELEKRRQYREEETERRPDGRYGLMFDRKKGRDGGGGGEGPERERSKSPPAREEKRPRERSRSPRRDRRDKEPRRSGSRERRHSRKEREGPRSRDDRGHRSSRR
jgi:peptidyl-prolyl cis-trans isomerase-like 4